MAARSLSPGVGANPSGTAMTSSRFSGSSFGRYPQAMFNCMTLKPSSFIRPMLASFHSTCGWHGAPRQPTRSATRWAGRGGSAPLADGRNGHEHAKAVSERLWPSRRKDRAMGMESLLSGLTIVGPCRRAATLRRSPVVTRVTATVGARWPVARDCTSVARGCEPMQPSAWRRSLPGSKSSARGDKDVSG